MSPDDRLALVVIFFVLVLPFLCFEAGTRFGRRRVLKAWRQSSEASKPTPYQPLTQHPPKPIPPDATTLVSDYEDAVYFMARHLVSPAGMTQGEVNAFQADQTRLYADVVRLRNVALDRLAGAAEPAGGQGTQ